MSNDLTVDGTEYNEEVSGSEVVSLPTNIHEDVKYYYKQNEYGLTSDKERLILYAKLVSTDYSSMEAYCMAYDIDFARLKGNKKSYARVNALIWRYLKRDDVREELEFIQLNLHSYFHDKHIKALEAQYNLGFRAKSEKVRADALHQFIQNTRNPTIGRPTDNDVKLMSESRQLLDSISSAFRNVSTPQLVCSGEEKPQHSIFTNSQNPKDSL